MGLPIDYKRIVEAYGYGLFGDFLWLHDPLHHGSADAFVTAVSLFPIAVNEGRQEYPAEYCPLDLYPFGKAVILGGTDASGSICWYEESKMDFIVTLDAEFSSVFGYYKTSISKFLLDWISGSLTPYDFPSDGSVVQRSSFTPFDS